MALDPTARESNVRDSLKKFFVDNLYKTEGIELLFDRQLATPDVKSKELNKWVSINFGNINPLALSSIYLYFYLCTRQDGEGYQLSQLRDKVMGYLTDSTMTDGIKRIPFYKTNVNPWEPLESTLLVNNIEEDAQILSPDGTKYKRLIVTIIWVAKI